MKIKKWMLVWGAILLGQCSAVSFASRCPSITDIKNNNISGWEIYDNEDDKPLSNARIAEFKNKVTEFALVEWVDVANKDQEQSKVNLKNSKNDKQEFNSNHRNLIHCYYRDATGSNLEAYLTKKKGIYTPLNMAKNWYAVTGYMQCAAGLAECGFRDENVESAQLAKK